MAKRVWIIGVTVGLVVAALVPTVSAGRPSLTPANALLSWKGKEFTAPTSNADPEACTEETCDEFTFSVDLPRGYWKHRWGGVEVSVRWHSEQDDFELYVYRGDEQVGASTGSFSEAEGVMLKRPRNGRYRAVIVPVAVKESDYEGIVQLEARRRGVARPNRRLLPNLKTLPLRDFRIVAPIFYGTGEPVPYGEEGQFSCYVDEAAETGARKCLRFSNGVSNVGRGRLTITMNVSEADDERKIYQIIRRNDGSRVKRDTGAQYEYHPTHAHLHYEGFASYDLFKVDPDTGERLEKANDGVKSGFCLIDVELVWWKKRGNERRHYSFPSCNVPQRGEGTYVLGISRGWADIYTWDLPDQYVDITGLPDGVYEVVSTADSARTLLEKTRRDNTRSAFLRITGDEVKKIPRPGS